MALVLWDYGFGDLGVFASIGRGGLRGSRLEWDGSEAGGLAARYTDSIRIHGRGKVDVVCGVSSIHFFQLYLFSNN
jgi:hypothetical protein